MQNNPFTILEKKIETLQEQIKELTQLMQRSVQPQGAAVNENKTGIDLAMEITGLSKGTIYNLVAEREIPHYKKRKRIYFDRQELNAWIKDGRRKTRNECIQV